MKMLEFQRPDGRWVYINPKHITSVIEAGNGDQALIATVADGSGSGWLVDTPVEIVVEKIALSREPYTRG